MREFRETIHNVGFSSLWEFPISLCLSAHMRGRVKLRLWGGVFFLLTGTVDGDICPVSLDGCKDGIAKLSRWWKAFPRYLHTCIVCEGGVFTGGLSYRAGPVNH